MTPPPELGDYKRFVKPHWTTHEVANLAVVAGFLRVLRSMDFERLLTDFGHHRYLQHNVAMHDGVDGVVKEGRGAAKRFPEFSIDAKHAYVDGDCVIIHSHMTTKAAHSDNDRRGLNVIDIWRVADGEIVEHWDAIQPVGPVLRAVSAVAGGAVNNRNGRY